MRDTEPTSRDSDRPIAVVVHLSGKLRGTSRILEGDRVGIGRSREAGADVVMIDDSRQDLLAVLERRGATYRLRAVDDAPLWVNGERVDALVLASGDVVEIGRRGTVLRYRLYPADRGPFKSVAEAFADCVDCARYGEGGWLSKARIFVTGVPREMATQTAPGVRITLASTLVALVVLSGALHLRSQRLEARLTAESERIEGLAELLEHAESRVLDREDFEAARADMERRLADRLDALEARAGAAARVIASASDAVVFLQGAYGFVDPATGRPLRHATAAGPRAAPSLGSTFSVDGTGPAVEVLYTGTGFLVSADGRILTNRHVAMPWAYDRDAQTIVRRGLQPVMRRFIGYLPGVVEPFEVTVVATSDSVDVALLHGAVPSGQGAVLPLSRDLTSPGTEVIVLGYPTGMRALLARADPSLVGELMRRGPMDFWEVARELSAANFIAPLATRGIVGQVTATTIVYDAQTTYGGSGGPVITLEGEVVAINMAVIPEFGGSNLGVPATEAAGLLRRQ